MALLRWHCCKSIIFFTVLFVICQHLFLSVTTVYGNSDKVVYLTSLEWHPYSGKKLLSQGASVLVAYEAFKAMGYELKVDFFPWQRAVYTARTDDRYAGYFPEYYAKEIGKDFIFSDPIGSGPIGFVERKDSPVQWDSINDLKKYKVGIVAGYVNTEEFDKMVKRKEIIAETVVDDRTNIKMVAAKRMPIAIIDKYVLQYMLDNDPALYSIKNEVRFNSKTLEMKTLYVCFKKNDKYKKIADIFNKGLKKINADKIMKDYFDKQLKKR